jgi:hypothetical protein
MHCRLDAPPSYGSFHAVTRRIPSQTSMFSSLMDARARKSAAASPRASNSNGGPEGCALPYPAGMLGRYERRRPKDRFPQCRTSFRLSSYSRQQTRRPQRRGGVRDRRGAPFPGLLCRSRDLGDTSWTPDGDQRSKSARKIKERGASTWRPFLVARTPGEGRDPSKPTVVEKPFTLSAFGKMDIRKYQNGAGRPGAGSARFYCCIYPCVVTGALERGARVPLSAIGFLTGGAIKPSRMACLRASLRARRMASAFSLAALTDGFS